MGTILNEEETELIAKSIMKYPKLFISLLIAECAIFFYIL